MYLTILWFSLNCLSFSLSSRSAELFVQDYIDSLRMKRLFIRLLHLFFEFVFHLAVKLYFPFSFGKTNYLFKIICPLLFVFYSNLSSIRLSKISCDLAIAADFRLLVGLDGLEPSTSRLSGARSSHLSYKPELTHRL